MFPSLVQLETKKLGNICAILKADRYLRGILQLSIAEMLRHNIDEDRRLVEVVATLLGHLKLTFNGDPSLENSFHELCKRHYNHTAKVLSWERQKRKDEPFVRDPNEIIEEHCKMKIDTESDLQW